MDDVDWHLFDFMGHVHLPRIFGLQITKFMLLELIASLLVIAIFVPLARRMSTGQPPAGPGTTPSSRC